MKNFLIAILVVILALMYNTILTHGWNMALVGYGPILFALGFVGIFLYARYLAINLIANPPERRMESFT